MELSYSRPLVSYRQDAVVECIPMTCLPVWATDETSPR